MILKLLSCTHHALDIILIGKTHKSGLAHWSPQWRTQWSFPLKEFSENILCANQAD